MKGFWNKINLIFIGWIFFLQIAWGQALPDIVKIDISIERNGMAFVPCRINGAPLSLIFDTGASFVSISSNVYNELTNQGRLIPSDIKGTISTKIADGSFVQNRVVNIEKFSLGGVFILYNVIAIVSPNPDAPLLLGNSVISRLENWKLDQMNKQLIFNSSDYDLSSDADLEILLKDAGKNIQLLEELIKASTKGESANFILLNKFTFVEEIGKGKLFTNGKEQLIVEGANNWNGFRVALFGILNCSKYSFLAYDVLFSQLYSRNPDMDVELDKNKPILSTIFHFLNSEISCNSYIFPQDENNGTMIVYEVCHDNIRTTFTNGVLIKY